MAAIAADNLVAVMMSSSRAVAGKQPGAVVGGVACAVLVTGARDEVELAWCVVRIRSLIRVAGTDDRRVPVGADLVTAAVGQEEVGGVVSRGQSRGEGNRGDRADGRSDDRSVLLGDASWSLG